MKTTESKIPSHSAVTEKFPWGQFNKRTDVSHPAFPLGRVPVEAQGYLFYKASVKKM